MKSIVNKAKKDVEYPCLMIGPGKEIVLFEKKGIGTNIAGDQYDLGHYSENWNMGLFEPFHGSVTLEDDS